MVFIRGTFAGERAFYVFFFLLLILIVVADCTHFFFRIASMKVNEVLAKDLWTPAKAGNSGKYASRCRCNF